MGLCSYTQQSSSRTKDHLASPQMIIHPQDSPLSTNQDSSLQHVGSTRLTWKHHLPRELALTELIHGSLVILPGLTTFVRHSEDSSTWLTLNLGSDTTCKGFSRHHISLQWYDIVHFGPKPSWICFWALPQKASYQWRYLSILIYP